MDHIYLLIFIFLLLGVFTGALSGFLGLGGGTIVVPSLIYIFSILKFSSALSIHLAIGTSMVCNFFSMASASRTHAKYRHIEFDLFLRFLPGLLLGSIIGPQIVKFLPAKELKMLFGTILLSISVFMLLDIRPQKPPEDSEEKSEKKDINDYKKNKYYKSWVFTTFIGTIVSCISSLSGLASGVFAVPIYNFAGLEVRKAIGTAAITGMVIALISSINYLFLNLPNHSAYSIGFVYWPAALTIGISSVIFANIFATMSLTIPSHILRKSFIVILIIISVLILIGK